MCTLLIFGTLILNEKAGTYNVHNTVQQENLAGLEFGDLAVQDKSIYPTTLAGSVSTIKYRRFLPIHEGSCVANEDVRCAGGGGGGGGKPWHYMLQDGLTSKCNEYTPEERAKMYRIYYVDVEVMRFILHGKCGRG